jgi:predicted CXXCH cytochrome family protein
VCLSCHNQTITTEGGRPIENIAALLAEKPNHHGPVRDGDCTACHDPHASEHAQLLVREYATDFYAPFRLDQYSLCFGCHSEKLVLNASGSGLTGFRDGDRNLHWLHVNREKGRTCRVCHEIHASGRPFHIRESVPFSYSGWVLPLNYEQRGRGGSCSPGCHAPQSYDRDRAAAELATRR